MPKNDFNKYLKYSLVRDQSSFDVEKTTAELIDHCEKSLMKNISFTLLADDRFKECTGNIRAGKMGRSVYPPHNHDFYEINYVDTGKCVEYIGSRAFVLNEGDFLILPPTVYHASYPVGDSKCVNIIIKSEWLSSAARQLSTYKSDSFLTRLQMQNSYMVFTAKDSAAFDTAKQLMSVFADKENNSPYRDLYAECIVLKMLLELSECTCTETFYTLPKKRISNDTTEDVLRYIKDNLSTVTLESTASHFGYSTSHLSKLIKKYTGDSFATYLAVERMVRAEYLLAKTDIAITKIPAIIGIESKEYFSRSFKKYNNVSPRQYRKEHR